MSRFGNLGKKFGKRDAIWTVLLIIATLVSPSLAAYLQESWRAPIIGPHLYIFRDETVVVPIIGTNMAVLQVTIKNDGTAPEKDVQVRVETTQPWVNSISNDTIHGYRFDSKDFVFRAGVSHFMTIILINPTVKGTTSGTLTISLKLLGETRLWDQYSLTRQW